MWKRKRIKILFTVDKKYKFWGACSATVNIDSQGDILENYCEDIEDLEDVEFVEILGKEDGTEELPNELEIDGSNINEVLKIYC